MSAADLAPFLVGLLGAWVLGGVAARLGGLLATGAGIAGLAIDPGGNALVVLACGASLWLVGHWHYALRHQSFKSPLARHLFCRGAPGWLDPTRGWALAVRPDEDFRREIADTDRGGTRDESER